VSGTEDETMMKHSNDSAAASRHLCGVAQGSLQCTLIAALAFISLAALCQSAIPSARPGGSAQTVPIISLDEAIKRARSSDINYRTAVADSGIAALDHSVARATLLPGVVYHNQFIYTQPGQAATVPVQPAVSPIFIANNGEYEYISQGIASETIALGQIADYRRLGAVTAAARARAEIARRGLVSTVVGLYYGELASEQKLAISRRAAIEAARFRDLAKKLEAGGEVSHADVIKALLQDNQRQRDLADATLAAERSRLDLAVLLFPAPNTAYTLTEIGEAIRPLPLRAEIDAAANFHNPDLHAALAAEHAAALELVASRAAYLPSLGVSYQYGIDAPTLSLKATDGARNLGYSVVATLDIPVWDWFATHDRIKQSVIRRDLARVELTATQRRLLASVQELYSEASVSFGQLQLLKDSVGNARESLRLVILRYQSGEATVLEAVDAQNALVTAETAQADGTLRYRAALANLQTLTGVLP
jgi:outer membrane protein TolC